MSFCAVRMLTPKTHFVVVVFVLSGFSSVFVRCDQRIFLLTVKQRRPSPKMTKLKSCKGTKLSQQHLFFLPSDLTSSQPSEKCFSFMRLKFPIVFLLKVFRNNWICWSAVAFLCLAKMLKIVLTSLVFSFIYFILFCFILFIH